MPHPSPRFSTEGGLEIEKTDSTTVKTIAEPYFLASFKFYRTAIKKYDDANHWYQNTATSGTKGAILSDGVHPTHAGYEMMEKIALKSLKKYLK